MSKIRSKNTKPELILRSKLFKKGFRFRVHQKDLAGKPDIVLPKYKTAIFVHGCFWHHHKNCPEGRIPATNSKFWKLKFKRNVKKDDVNIKVLQKNKWQVIVVWECEIEKRPELIVEKVIKKLSKYNLV